MRKYFARVSQERRCARLATCALQLTRPRRGYPQATFHITQALEYGTNMVGGVSPKKAGQTHLGLPVFGSVREVSDPLFRWNAYVPPDSRYGSRPYKRPNPMQPSSMSPLPQRQTQSSKPLRTRSPSLSLSPRASLSKMKSRYAFLASPSIFFCHRVGDSFNMCVVQVMNALKAQSKSRLVGPNCPGIINPAGCKIGIMPGHIHKPGKIGGCNSFCRNATLRQGASCCVAPCAMRPERDAEGARPLSEAIPLCRLSHICCHLPQIHLLPLKTPSIPTTLERACTPLTRAVPLLEACKVVHLFDKELLALYDGLDINLCPLLSTKESFEARRTRLPCPHQDLTIR